MRYNPATDRALSIDEIAAQCKAAIMKASAPAPAPCSWEDVAALEDDDFYAENPVLWAFAWENDLMIPA
jgi:hypothetical protein